MVQIDDGIESGFLNPSFLILIFNWNWCQFEIVTYNADSE